MGFRLQKYDKVTKFSPVHPAYNPSFSACFFSRNSIFLSQQISQRCFSAGLSAQLNGAFSVTVSTNAQSKETSQTGEKQTYCHQELIVSSGTNKTAH
jgi:hypothetical protein